MSIPIETNPDEQVKCPFDDSHLIIKSRLQWHITTCAKKNKPGNIVRCTYDASHFVSKDKFEEHLLNCPSRQEIINASNYQEEAISSSILPINATQDADDTDGWGSGACASEATDHTLSPLQAIKNRHSSQPTIGMSKAERKKHKQEMRKRFNEMEKRNEKKDKC